MLVEESTSITGQMPALPLTQERIDSFKFRDGKSPYLAQYIAELGISKLDGNPEIIPENLETKYTIKCGEITDQKSSGRCWIFAGLNMLRISLLKDKQFGEKFSFSQNYINFWDKMERANYFLNKMVELGNLPFDDQRMQNVLERVFVQGGEWELFANIVEKYGVVPSKAMKETKNSESAAKYMKFLSDYLRERGGRLHILSSERADIAKINAVMEQTLKVVYNVSVGHLGEPPKKVEWKNKEGKLQRMKPVEFRDLCGIDLSTKVHLTNLPYLDYNIPIVVEDVSNMVGGMQLKGFNVSMEVMKEAIRKSIKKDDAVLSASETKDLDKNKAVMSLDSPAAYEVFEIDRSLNLSKADRLQYRSTRIAHAMLLIGCDDPWTNRYEGESLDELDDPCTNRYEGESFDELPETAGPLWQVENSWGKEICPKIFMTDSWFDEYCYGVVVDKKYLPEETKEILANPDLEPTILPGYDPYGRI